MESLVQQAGQLNSSEEDSTDDQNGTGDSGAMSSRLPPVWSLPVRSGPPVSLSDDTLPNGAFPSQALSSGALPSHISSAGALQSQLPMQGLLYSNANVMAFQQQQQQIAALQQHQQQQQLAAWQHQHQLAALQHPQQFTLNGLQNPQMMRQMQLQQMMPQTNGFGLAGNQLGGLAGLPFSQQMRTPGLSYQSLNLAQLQNPVVGLQSLPPAALTAQPPPSLPPEAAPASTPADGSGNPATTSSLLEQYGSDGTKEPPFPLKLHQILSNPEYQDCISWLPHGKSWRILKPSAFEQVVIPLFFRHAKYASFMRQVNGWGFKRVSNLYRNELGGISLRFDHAANKIYLFRNRRWCKAWTTILIIMSCSRGTIQSFA
jgi:hypothetical protein